MALYHVYGIGNAIVDLEYQVPMEQLLALGVAKGEMTLAGAPQLRELLQKLEGKQHRRASGGSCANSIIALAQFGGEGFFTGRVGTDALGDFYLQDLKNAGVATTAKGTEGNTGRSVILITPDSERSMTTYLGVSSLLEERDIDKEAVEKAAYLYIEGYLVSSPSAKAAAVAAKEYAGRHGVQVVLSLSDVNMVNFFREGMNEIIGEGVDLLFCNEKEAYAFAESEDLDEVKEALRSVAQRFVLTFSELGSLVYDGQQYHEIAPVTVKAVDATGAGDMYAGAFLYALTQGKGYAVAGNFASHAAAEVVTHFGPRLPAEKTKKLLQFLQ